MTNLKHYLFAVVATLLLLFPAPGWTQASISPLDGYTPGQVLQGGPAGSIPLSNFEVFNPANSQISINIPLLTVQGRGPVSVPLIVPLTNPVWESLAVQYRYNCPTPCTTGYGYIVQTTGWNPFPATVGQGGSMVMRGSGDYCNGSAWHLTLTRGTFTAPDGTQIEFIDQATKGTPESQGYNRGTAFIADNGSNAKFGSSSAIVDPTSCGVSAGNPSGTMTLSNGTVYTINSGLVTQIEDSNGNITKFSAGAITDNLGRSYNVATGSDSNGNYDAITYHGYNNNTGKIDVLAYSGGAGAFTAAYGQLSASDQQRVGNILYVSPGAAGSIATNDQTTVVRGSDLVDVSAMLGTAYPAGTPTAQAACDHQDFACLSNSPGAVAAFQAMEANGPCTKPKVFSLPPVNTKSTLGGKGGAVSVMLGGGTLVWNEFDLLQMLLNGYNVANAPGGGYTLSYSPRP